MPPLTSHADESQISPLLFDGEEVPVQRAEDAEGQQEQQQLAVDELVQRAPPHEQEAGEASRGGGGHLVLVAHRHAAALVALTTAWPGRTRPSCCVHCVPDPSSWQPPPEHGAPQGRARWLPLPAAEGPRLGAHRALGEHGRPANAPPRAASRTATGTGGGRGPDQPRTLRRSRLAGRLRWPRWPRCSWPSGPSVEWREEGGSSGGGAQRRVAAP